MGSKGTRSGNDAGNSLMFTHKNSLNGMQIARLRSYCKGDGTQGERCDLFFVQKHHMRTGRTGNEETPCENERVSRQDNSNLIGCPIRLFLYIQEDKQEYPDGKEQEHTRTQETVKEKRKTTGYD